ncbi:MAG TPA: hypothetical protein VF520_08150 [Thermoleophilaceae bacterium]
MALHATLTGRTTQARDPDWQPLLDFAPECIDDFMWMFEVETECGLRLQAYKHRWTRGYLHLSHDGRAFVYVEDGRDGDDALYREVDPLRLLTVVLEPRPGREPEWAIPPRARRRKRARA